MNKLNFELLHIFDVVSRFSSFSQASNYLYLDQSTVSKKIKQLEEIVNQKLFTRNANGIVLSTAGIVFRKKAIQILHELSELMNFDPQIENLRIGVFDNISAYLMSNFFTKYFNQFKKLKISSKSIELVNLFNDGKLDAMIINSEFFDQIQGETIETSITNENFAILFNKENNFFESTKQLYLSNLKSKNIILAPNYCPVNSKIHHIINSFNDYIELDYVDSMVKFVLSSNYITILPISMAHTLATQHNSLAFIKLTDLPKRQISLFTREENINYLLQGLVKTA